VSEIETIREALADGAELDIKQREMAREALDALTARLEAAEQALRAIADQAPVVRSSTNWPGWLHENSIYRDRLTDQEIARAALARQPSQEQPVPCDQHDAGHQAGWA
jgi:hypothetical protein